MCVGAAGGGGISPTRSNEPRSVPRAAVVWGVRVFSHEQNGCRQRLILLPIAAASKISSCCCSPHVNREWRGRTAVGVGANARAAVWGCSRECAHWQEGDACACACAEQAQAASSPYVFVLENKISIFCDRGMNHALPGVHSLTASPGESALSPGGAEHHKSKGACFFSLRIATLLPWERDLGRQRGKLSPCHACCGVTGKAGNPSLVGAERGCWGGHERVPQQDTC